MKITDLIAEQQIDELTAAGVGQGVGKAAGAVGAVAGGVKGAWQAAKKGFEKGRATVAGETPPQAAPAAGTAAPAAGTAAPAAAPGQAAPAAQGDANDPAGIQQQIKQKELELKDLQGKLRAAQKGADNAAKAEKDAAQTQQAQQVAKAPAAEPATTAPAAEPTAPAADAATQARIAAAPQGYDTETGKPIATPAAAPEPTQQAATTPAAEPTAPAADSKLTAAQQAAMKAKLQGKRAAGQTAGTTASGFKQYTKDASSQRVVGANPDGSPKIQTIKASKINTGNNLSESLARKIEQHKRKMFETGLTNGTSSVFVK
jgi:Meckel syndrome type 1 protein